MAGFTIMEVLVAVTILGMAYLVVLQSFSVSMRNIERIDRSGYTKFEAMLEMDKQFLAVNMQSDGEQVDGEVFVEDSIIRVMAFTDENGLLFSLKREVK